MAKDAPRPAPPRPNDGAEGRRARFSPYVGDHKFSLEYALLEYVLKGYNATTIARKLAEEHPELGVSRLKPAAILHYLKRAFDHQIVQIKPPRLAPLEATLHNIYDVLYGKAVTFYVADDSIGFLQHRAMTSFFWNLAAEAIDDNIAALLEAGDAPTDQEIVVGNTGGVSASEAIKYLSRVSFDPTYLDKGRNRLWFLSLTAVGTSEHFDLHANYLAALLGHIYGGHHMAVMDRANEQPERVRKAYEQRLDKMQMIIGGVGTVSGYLRNWFVDHGVKQPAGMIGDIFFHPIGKDGKILDLDAATRRALEPLQLHPSKQGLMDFLSQARRHRSLIIVTEPTGVDKSHVLDLVLRGGYVTDCVLGSNLANRLRNLHPVPPKGKGKPGGTGR